MQEFLTTELLERLYIQHEKTLFNIAYRWVWNEQDAQDLVHDGFIKLWEVRSRVKTESVEAYLYKIVLNLAAKHRRWHKLRQFLPELLEGKETRDGLHYLEEDRNQQRIRSAFDKLPQKTKQTLMLCEFSEFSYEQIAQILGIPVGTVGSRRNNAMKVLKAHINGKDGYE